MLTLIVIPTGKLCKEMLDSFNGITTQLEYLEYGQNFDVPVTTKWKIYLYEGEFLSKDLKQSLPVFLEKGGDCDCFSIYKSSPTGFSISPRLFKGSVKVQDRCLLPVNENLKITAILDGFILQR